MKRLTLFLTLILTLALAGQGWAATYHLNGTSNIAVSGSVTGTFTVYETLTQATSAATAKYVSGIGTGPIVVSQVTGAPDTSHTWSGASGSFTPTAVPVANGSDSNSGASGSPWFTLTHALTGSRMNQGDTLVINDSGIYSETHFSTAVGAGSGSTIIQPNTGAMPTFNIPDNNYICFIAKPFTIQNINLTNTANHTGAFFELDGANLTTEFDGCTFDSAYGSASVNGGLYIVGSYTQAVILRRCTIKNNYNFIITGNSGSGFVTLTMESCKTWNNNLIAADTTQIPVALVLTNNTFTKPGAAGDFFSSQATTSSVTAQNNIFVGGGTGFNYTGFAVSAAAADAWIATPALWNVTNNVFWDMDASLDASMDNLVYVTSQDDLPVDISNKMINPSFNNYAGYDYTLASTSYAAGQGNTTHPSGGDITGAAYGPNDVGCYVNPPTLARPALNGKVGFDGDSIFQGIGASNTATTSCWADFGALTGRTMVSVSGANPMGVGGLCVRGALIYLDQLMITYSPSLVFVDIGLNDLVGPKTHQTNAQVATEIIKVLQKVANYHARPVWMGITSLSGSPPVNTNVAAINTLVDAACVTNGWKYGDILTQFMLDTNWKTDYYASLSNNVHPNDAGHLVIAQLAQSIYQTMGSSPMGLGLGMGLGGFPGWQHRPTQ